MQIDIGRDDDQRTTGRIGISHPAAFLDELLQALAALGLGQRLPVLFGLFAVSRTGHCRTSQLVEVQRIGFDFHIHLEHAAPGERPPKFPMRPVSSSDETPERIWVFFSSISFVVKRISTRRNRFGSGKSGRNDAPPQPSPNRSHPNGATSRRATGRSAYRYPTRRNRPDGPSYRDVSALSSERTRNPAQRRDQRPATNRAADDGAPNRTDGPPA